MSAPFLTEAQIEASAEREMDRLDAKLLAGLISAGEYDRRVRDIDDRAARRYRELTAEAEAQR